ncbi:MarR family transcriptional regulator [Ruania suaedae]|uniref:MarR family winged helix-turn-helix transcriptional regulator n=1 Tax=Ruania suaedae TaxID=2897774 RepID=UPI001E4F9307|nr:MarR family transcriptional regulator [Ruania suaedae]UFU04480.1 MarR family transcriptional regulator [Ruania suaedae]
MGTQESPRAVDRMLCFALYTASRVTTQAYRRVLAPWGLTYPQFLVLVELWDRGPLTVSDLGEDLALDSGTLSPLLTRLERSGFVSRSRTSEDARVVTVQLTAAGSRLREDMAEVPGQIADCMNLEPYEAKALISSLQEYTDVVETRSGARHPYPTTTPHHR